MGTPEVSLDLAASPGAVVSAAVTPAPGEQRRLIELAELVRLDVQLTDAHVRVQVRNLSRGDMRWTDALGNGQGLAGPGTAVEHAAPSTGGPLCLQFVFADAVALTVTLSVTRAGARRRVLAQAVVSR